MDFIDQIKELSSKISKRSERLETEEATKTARVMPFIKTLGYDVLILRKLCQNSPVMLVQRKGKK